MIFSEIDQVFGLREHKRDISRDEEFTQPVSRRVEMLPSNSHQYDSPEKSISFLIFQGRNDGVPQRIFNEMSVMFGFFVQERGKVLERAVGDLEQCIQAVPEEMFHAIPPTGMKDGFHDCDEVIGRPADVLSFGSFQGIPDRYVIRQAQIKINDLFDVFFLNQAKEIINQVPVGIKDGSAYALFDVVQDHTDH